MNTTLAPTTSTWTLIGQFSRHVAASYSWPQVEPCPFSDALSNPAPGSPVWLVCPSWPWRPSRCRAARHPCCYMLTVWLRCKRSGCRFWCPPTPPLMSSSLILEKAGQTVSMPDWFLIQLAMSTSPLTSLGASQPSRMNGTPRSWAGVNIFAFSRLCASGAKAFW